MRIRRSFVRRINFNGRFLQRGALFFLALGLVFGLVEPGINTALALTSSERQFNPGYKLSPLNSDKLQLAPVLTQEAGEPLDTPKVENPRGFKYEDTSKRTEFTSTYVNNDGSRTMKYSSRQLNYQDGQKWEKINNTLDGVQQKAPDPTFWESITNTAPKAPDPEEFNGKAGSTSVNIKSLSTGVTIKSEEKTITMKPVGAKNVKPVRQSESSIIYKDAWPNVDVVYELYGETIKEVIVLKSKDAKANYAFSVTGGKIIHHPTRAGELTIEGLPEEYSFSALTLSLEDRGVISEERVVQAPTADGKGIAITVDEKWLRAQPASSFPMYIDPTYNKDAQTYWMYKSDGFSCNASNCHANVGTLYDNGWKHWRTYFKFPFSNLAGKKILNATLHGVFQPGKGGETAGRTIWMGHASGTCYNCRGSQVGSVGGVGTNFDINFTDGLQGRVNANDWNAVWSLWGEEGSYTSFKPYYDIIAYTTYDTPAPIAQPASPANGQVVVNTQPSLRVNTVTDADGDAVEYYYRVTTKPDAETGAVINSGWTKSTQWTVPGDILQDGTTYYWHTYTRGATQTNPNWVRSFKVDLRSGKDSTQSYDTVGPVGVDLATGNATLASGTHSMSALGGDINVGLTYNTPNRAKTGLRGEYWSVTSSYNFANGVPTGAPKTIRRDANINFDWGTGSPAGGVNTDWFYARWTGQFIAPVSGTYKFGGNNDDNMKVVVDGQSLYNQACGSGICYNEANSITLAAGQVVPIRVDFMEATHPAYAKLYTKGPVSQQIVPSDWLYTDPVSEPKSYGLTGNYYIDTGDRNVDNAAATASRLMMVRHDTNLNFSFGTGGPAQGLRTDNFLVRWTGYITVPTTGTYKLGAKADDGIRIKIKNGTSWTTPLDSWNWTNYNDRWSGNVTLPANTPIPITIDYNESGGGAGFVLRVQDATGTQRDMPTTWLTPNANVLPEQWKLGVDVGGAASYDRLRVTGNSVILEDSTGSTHEYIYTNGGYRPPANENGTLVKSNDSTYTFVDIDGRTYIFDANGNLISLTSPTDDKKPAALKYEYAGDPSRLMKIEDGVTNTRYATVYYKGVNDTNGICDPNNAPNSPATFFGLFAQFDQAPDGMLCAFGTSDSNVTNFYYKNGYLARVVQPGSQITDYAYDTLGRITTVRDPLASDVIGANVRTDDDSVTTQLAYDALGRISSIKPPSATSGADRPEHTFDYGIGKTEFHLAGAPEPNGFSRRVQYDSLLRTTTDTDLTGKSTQTEWDTVKDLQLSTTSTTGLKSTTIYDAEDRAVESYGPAPAAWYETSGTNNRKPLAGYATQVPRISTAYDQDLKGPAVTWYDVKGANMTLFGAPKAYTTGFSSSIRSPELGNSAYLRHVFETGEALPMQISTDNGITGYGFVATGMFTTPQTGTYTFTMYSDDSVALYIDDVQVLSNWGTKTADGVTNLLTGTLAATAGKSYRFQLRYAYDGNDKGTMGLAVKGPGIPDTMGNGTGTRDWSAYLKPGYNLTTSTTVYDNQIGNVVNTTQYSNPAYGQVSSSTIDPAGLNYVGQAVYETPGSGYLRQTSKTSPGGVTTTYQHYEGTDTRDNPCTTETESYHQAGMPKGKTDPTGRTTETIYNESGDIVAIRYNDDSWTCITYDERGRIVNNVILTANGKTGRTVSNNYAANGNPLITSTTDSNGTLIIEVDLLGRTVRYIDVKDNVTENTYDNFGKLTSRSSPVGVELFEYDTFDRLTQQKLDGVTFSTITYDEFSRVDTVDYPEGMSLLPAVRDSLGRVNKVSYNVNDQDISDEVTRSVSGFVLSGIENGISKSYTYDKAARLTSARIGDDALSYGFSTPDASCESLSGNNIDAGKAGNRTSYTMNGQTTTYCYDMGDQLIASSDPRFSQIDYDTHGNTVRLGDDTHKTEFVYDISDRNTSIKETTATGDRETVYERDASNRVYHRTYKVDDVITENTYYGFTGSSDSPSFLTDGNGAVTQKFLNLVGGVKVTIKPQSTSAGAITYSLSNVQGNTMATVSADGTPTVIEPSGPFGERLAGHVSPANTAVGMSNDYLGLHHRTTETDYIIQPIQMGARVYIPELGRFMQIDPVEGGTINTYVYALDPVNQADIEGKFIFVPIMIVTLITIVSVAVAASSVKTAVKDPTPTNIGIATLDAAGAVLAPFTGGTSSAATKGAGAAIRAAAGSSTKGAAQVVINRAAGKEAERIAFERAKAQYAKEYEVRAQQYFKVDGFPKGRFADIAIMKAGQPVLLIEVKSGNAKYGGMQLLKDQAILEQYSAPTVVERITLTGK